MMSRIGFKSHRLRRLKSAPSGALFQFAETVVPKRTAAASKLSASGLLPAREWRSEAETRRKTTVSTLLICWSSVRTLRVRPLVSSFDPDTAIRRVDLCRPSLCGTVVQPIICTAWASEEPVREHSTGSSDTADPVDGLRHALRCCPDSTRLIRSLCSNVADVHTQLQAPRIERGGLLRVRPTRARPVL